MKNSIFLICLILIGKMFLKFFLYITLISLNLLLALHKTTSQERITKNKKCLFRPCLNGGLCTLNDDSSFSCKCSSNWMGNFCQFSKLEEVRVKKLSKTHAIQDNKIIGHNSSVSSYLDQIQDIILVPYVNVGLNSSSNKLTTRLKKTTQRLAIF
jgi:hypothetical protein